MPPAGYTLNAHVLRAARRDEPLAAVARRTGLPLYVLHHDLAHWQDQLAAAHARLARLRAEPEERTMAGAWAQGAARKVHEGDVLLFEAAVRAHEAVVLGVAA